MRTMKEEKQNPPRSHVQKTVASQTVSGPVMFLQACNGVKCASELTVGRNLHVSYLCTADGYLRRSMIVLFWSDPQPVILSCTGFCMVFFSFILPEAQFNFEVLKLFSWAAADAGWCEINCGIPPAGDVGSDPNLMHDVSQERFACSPSLRTSQAVATVGSHMCIKRWFAFSCRPDVLGGSHCYFKETPAGLTTGWQHLLTVIYPHAGCENGPACGKITHLLPVLCGWFGVLKHLDCEQVSFSGIHFCGN